MLDINIVNVEAYDARAEVTPMSEKFQCLAFPARGEQCIRYEGHSGPHSPGPAPKAASNCPVCGTKFASRVDFEKHVPCMKP
jgi:hypothetical protein